MCIRDFFDEMEDFPEGAHDDMIDSVTGCYKLLTGKKGIKTAIGRNTSEGATGGQKPGKNQLGSLQNGKPKRSSVTFGRRN
jgi:hypothetical protein